MTDEIGVMVKIDVTDVTTETGMMIEEIVVSSNWDLYHNSVMDNIPQSIKNCIVEFF